MAVSGRHLDYSDHDPGKARRVINKPDAMQCLGSIHYARVFQTKLLFSRIVRVLLAKNRYAVVAVCKFLWRIPERLLNIDIGFGGTEPEPHVSGEQQIEWVALH